MYKYWTDIVLLLDTFLKAPRHPRLYKSSNIMRYPRLLTFDSLSQGNVRRDAKYVSFLADRSANEGGMAAQEAHQAMLMHLCISREIQLSFFWLSICRAVCRSWRDTVQEGLQTIHVLDFCGHEVRVVTADVQSALARMANLRILNLGSCRRISFTNMAKILRLVRDSCHHVHTVDVTGCSEPARLCAAAIHAKSVFGVASPRELFIHLKTLQEGASGVHRGSWDDLCRRLFDGPPPNLILGPQAPRRLRELFFFLAEHGHAWEMALLIETDAQATVSDTLGKTLLHWAAEKGHIETLELLIETGTDVNAVKIMDKDLDYHTPLYMAFVNGDIKMMCMLIAAGADVQTDYEDNKTLLHLAVENDAIEAFKLLIEAKANVNAEDMYGDTPLLLSLDSSRCNGGNGRRHAVATVSRQIEMQRILVKAGADVNKGCQQEDVSLLHLAVENFDVGALELLIEAKANVNVENWGKQTPLHYAARDDHRILLKLLIKAGANVNAQDDDQKTPLHLAVLDDHCEVLKLLIKAGADPNAQDENGYTLMHIAAEKGHTNAIRLLIDAGANLNLKDGNGATLMHILRRVIAIKRSSCPSRLAKT